MRPIGETLTVIGHSVCTSTGRQDACNRYPEGQNGEGQYSPPRPLERSRRLEQEAVEQQERQLHEPKHQV